MTSSAGRLDDLFVMRKGDRMAVCALHTHDLGWECRLFSGEDMIATQVCRNDAEIESFCEDVARGRYKRRDGPSGNNGRFATFRPFPLDRP